MKFPSFPKDQRDIKEQWKQLVGDNRGWFITGQTQTAKMALLPSHNWSVGRMYSICFHFSLEKVTCYIPSGSHNFTSCIVLKAPKHQASLLHQMAKSPEFHEMTFAYLQDRNSVQ